MSIVEPNIIAMNIQVCCARLFYLGLIKKSILMPKACENVGHCYEIEKIETLLGVPAFGLIARIKRYADGRNLKIPEALNDEVPPFWAIKHAYCAEDWADFRARDGKENELTHLRAYFWDENCNEESLMCITHFAIKQGRTISKDDVSISNTQKFNFKNSGYYYEK